MAEQRTIKLQTAPPEKDSSINFSLNHEFNLRKFATESQRIRYWYKEAIRRLENMGKTSIRRDELEDALGKINYTINTSGQNLL